MVKIMGKSYEQMDDLVGFTPIFGNTLLALKKSFGSSYSIACLVGDFLTDSTMGFITIFHHHRGGNIFGSRFPGIKQSQIQVIGR